MNNVLKKKKILLLIFFISIITLLNLNGFIISHSWKVVSDNQVSAYMNFKDNSLYLEGKKIKDKENNHRGYVLLCLYKYLIVINDTNKVCLYIKK